MKTLAITATTDVSVIEAVIPFADMRKEAIDRRNDAAAVLPEQGDQEVLEIHELGDAVVLYSPVFGYALVNQRGPGVSDSLLVENGEADSPEHAAEIWAGNE